MNAHAVNSEDICTRLFMLEASVIRRLKGVVDTSPDKLQGLRLHLFSADGGSNRHLVDRILKEHSRTKSASGFRPSTRRQYSLTGQLWRYQRRSSLEELAGIADALTDSMCLPAHEDTEWSECFISAIQRPTKRPDDWRADFSRSLVHQFAAACQLVTAAAHADNYGQFSIHLLTAYSRSVLDSLAASEVLLSRLD